MEYTVINHDLCVGNIKITVVAGASVFIIGDSEVITPSSIFDTPPEALTIGPFSPPASKA
ncbi:MAG: spore gernimation protein GerPD [Vulcanibacillus sp.]